ncbi:predicted protein [Postia placenta Mad-698-R]|nr:predicted protein [Postia placenta Mad-698-R]
MSTTTQILFNSPALHSLKREQLVKLCKIHSIKASGKNAELIERLKQRAQELPQSEDGTLHIGGLTFPSDVDVPRFQMPRPSEQWEIVMEDIEEVQESTSLGTISSKGSLRTQGTAGEFGTSNSKSSTVGTSIKALATSLGIKRATSTKSSNSEQRPPSIWDGSRQDELTKHAVPYSELPPAPSLPRTDAAVDWNAGANADGDVSIATRTIPATHVVLAAGAWSPHILPALPITGTRAHSITIRPRDGVAIAPYVLFTEIQFPSAAAGALQQVSPEIYARPDNEVYCCGPGDNSRVPETVDDVEVDQSACESIREHVASISAELRDGAVDKRQACFLPVVSTGGGPIVGEATSIAKGLVIATGHTCWVGILALAAPLLAATDVFSDWGFLQGICNAPGTAKAVAELVMEGKIKCANLKNLQPGRFL